MHRMLAAVMGILLALRGTGVLAGDMDWRPGLGRPVAMRTRDQADSERPAVRLGRPEPLNSSAGNDNLVVTGFRQAAAPPATVVRAQSQDPAAPAPGSGVGIPGIPTSPAEQYNCGVANQAPATSHPVWDGTKKFFNNLFSFNKNSFEADGRHHWFESDDAFPDFVSPLSNPFLFEDPRSLTELRPVFIFQSTPSRTPVFRGGDIGFIGLQGRVAFTERLSLVVNKFGAIWISPEEATADINSNNGFGEIWLGPKYTFLRNEGTGSIAAAGLTFQIPGGSKDVLQDTGSLTLGPYVSYGQRFGQTRYGTFHFLGTAGYNLALDSERSDNLFISLHLDYDIAGLHKFYPFLELNYFYYAKNGTVRDLNFEGADLVNLGSRAVSGDSELSMASGMRYKWNESIQFGFGFQTALTGRDDLLNYRVTADVIFRY